MAIYHASTKPISRSSGRSAVAAAAYRAGESIEDERTGKQHDYTKKGGVVFSESLGADGLPCDRAQLWNAAESAENRKDGRVAREWLVALPDELSADQRRELAQDFAAELRERYGVATDVCIHAPDSQGDNRNYHAHILTTTRTAERAPDGSIELHGKSEIEWSNKRRGSAQLGTTQNEIKTLRASWEQHANQALERAGHSERIDHRSFKDQGIERQPTIKMGQAATDLERRGIATERGDINRGVRVENQILELEIQIKQRDKAAQRATERPISADKPQNAPEPHKTPQIASDGLKSPQKTDKQIIEDFHELVGKGVDSRWNQYQKQRQQHLKAKQHKLVAQYDEHRDSKPKLFGVKEWQRELDNLKKQADENKKRYYQKPELTQELRDRFQHETLTLLGQKRPDLLKGYADAQKRDVEAQQKRQREEFSKNIQKQLEKNRSRPSKSRDIGR